MGQLAQRFPIIPAPFGIEEFLKTRNSGRTQRRNTPHDDEPHENRVLVATRADVCVYRCFMDWQTPEFPCFPSIRTVSQESKR